MTGPVIPSGADFDEERDLGGGRPGRIGRFIERIRSTPRRPVTAPAQVDDGVGENLRIATAPTSPRRSRATPTTQASTAPKQPVATPRSVDRAAAATPPAQKRVLRSPAGTSIVPPTVAPAGSGATPAPAAKRPRKRLVVDPGVVPTQPSVEDDAPYVSTWDPSRGLQRNVRDTLQPSRDSSYYDD